MESRFIVPRVYGRALRLPAAVILLALLIRGKLLGILGALLSLPVAAAIRMLVYELRVALPGESVDAADQAKDATSEAEFMSRTRGLPARYAAVVASDMAKERREAEQH